MAETNEKQLRNNSKKHSPHLITCGIPYNNHLLPRYAKYIRSTDLCIHHFALLTCPSSLGLKLTVLGIYLQVRFPVACHTHTNGLRAPAASSVTSPCVHFQ